MFKAPRPWPTPPSSSFRSEAYFCHNCGSEENTLGVGTWMEDDINKHRRNKLVLCRNCFEDLSQTIVRTTGLSGYQFTLWFIRLKKFFRKDKKNDR